MTKVVRSKDCGNSPKNRFLETLAIAFAKRDAKFLLDSVVADIRWNFVGEELIQGKSEFSAAIERMKNNEVMRLTIQHVVTHGKAGAVNGIIEHRNGKVIAFCDMYEFDSVKGARVKEITSWMI